jgi:hypothetical protein
MATSIASCTKPLELVSHDDFTAAHTARVASINNVKAAELAELESATTRAHTAHTRALNVAVTEHAAERLARHEAVVSESIDGLRTPWENYIVDRAMWRGETLGNGKRPWLDRPPHNGRLLVRGKCRPGVGDVLGYQVWYCCARYGRSIPVRDWGMSVGVGSPELYDAPFDEFSCVANPPYNLNSAGDGLRAAYDAALAALSVSEARTPFFPLIS